MFGRWRRDDRRPQRRVSFQLQQARRNLLGISITGRILVDRCRFENTYPTAWKPRSSATSGRGLPKCDDGFLPRKGISSAVGSSVYLRLSGRSGVCRRRRAPASQDVFSGLRVKYHPAARPRTLYAVLRPFQLADFVIAKGCPRLATLEGAGQRRFSPQNPTAQSGSGRGLKPVQAQENSRSGLSPVLTGSSPGSPNRDPVRTLCSY